MSIEGSGSTTTDPVMEREDDDDIKVGVAKAARDTPINHFLTRTLSMVDNDMGPRSILFSSSSQLAGCFVK